MKLNKELLDRLTTWAEEGHREFEICAHSHQKGEKPSIRVWLYDYDLGGGVYLEEETDNFERVIMKEKRKQLNEAIDTSTKALRKLNNR